MNTAHVVAWAWQECVLNQARLCTVTHRFPLLAWQHL
jgi:hypothetical protein